MTLVDVGGVGYTRASQVLGDANRWAASHVDELSAALCHSGAMAGDSSFASDFAAAYDEAATAALAAFDDLVGSLGALCRLATCSLENHSRAEQASVSGPALVADAVDVSNPALYETRTPAPPSSLGGDASVLPDWANVILDHVEGFVWPDADLDRLRATATAWRTACDQLHRVATRITEAVVELWEERSPEVPLAVGALTDLRAGVYDLAATCHDLGTACDDYATAVETQRELILDLVRDLIRDAVLIAAAGFVLGLVSGGSTNAVAAWINAGKLGAQVPRFHAFLETLRLYAAGAASGLRSVTGAVVRVRARWERFLSARAVHSLERGAIGSRQPLTWLGRHEGGSMGAHTLSKHVGKSDQYLRKRLARETDRAQVSTFTDEATAERSIRALLQENSTAVEKWLRSPTTKRKEIEGVMPHDVGRIMSRGGAVRAGRGVKMVLVKDSSMPDGYRILTSMVK